MFNSCLFNSVKFNSVCITQPVTPIQPPTGGEARIDQRKRRLFKREFFNLIGTKLFFHQEFFDIIGTKLINDQQFNEIISSILLPHQLKIDLASEILTKEVQDLLFLQGKVQYPIKIERKIFGAKKFPSCMYHIVKGKRLILSKQLELIYGKKLVLSIEYKALKYLKKVPCKQINLIRGQKDITEILEILDMLEEE